MKYLSAFFTNGALLIYISLLHTSLVISPEGGGEIFWKFSETYFFEISNGMEEFPAQEGRSNFQSFAVFWFFYFGLLLIPVGALIHVLERRDNVLPFSFIALFTLVVAIGAYMIPASGMTYIMLPFCVIMFVRSFIKQKRLKRTV